jgi:hypothetical protein
VDVETEQWAREIGWQCYGGGVLAGRGAMAVHFCFSNGGEGGRESEASGRAE